VPLDRVVQNLKVTPCFPAICTSTDFEPPLIWPADTSECGDDTPVFGYKDIGKSFRFKELLNIEERFIIR
jgi:hypothetical protein